MGVNFKEIIIKHPISLEELSGKTLIVDGYNMLYQFLSTIRARDGSLLTDSKGRVTSQLIGLFSRTSNLMSKHIKLAFVFDGKMPELKHKELAKRAELKKAAHKKYEEALATEDMAGMQKYAARTSRLTREMVQDAQQLLTALGVPWVQAPSEGEAQAAHMVKKGHGWAVASQDYDSLIHGTPRLLQNLSIEGRRKVAGTLSYKNVEPQLIDLQENLNKLGLTQDQLTWLAILIGTDYAPQGVKGIGPKKGLQMVKQHKTPETLFKDLQLEADWKEVLSVFKNIPVTDDYELTWHPPNRKQVHKFLVEERDFSPERVDKTLDTIAPKNQTGLGNYI